MLNVEVDEWENPLTKAYNNLFVSVPKKTTVTVTVPMIAPTGNVIQVPAKRVEFYKSLGLNLREQRVEVKR